MADPKDLLDIDALLGKGFPIRLGGKVYHFKDVPINDYLETERILDEGLDGKMNPAESILRQLATFLGVKYEELRKENIGLTAAVTAVNKIRERVFGVMRGNAEMPEGESTTPGSSRD